MKQMRSFHQPSLLPVVCADSCCGDNMIGFCNEEADGDQTVNDQRDPGAFCERGAKYIPVDDKNQVEKKQQKEKGEQHEVLLGL